MRHLATDRIVNFAYGSNMLPPRILARVPSARVLGTAVLHGRVLRWHKQGQDGSGKCDVVASSVAGARVHGVLYDFPAHEKPGLDRAEGLGAGYEEQVVEVEAAFGPVRCRLYAATHVDPQVRPFSWYRALVVAGARWHGLPPAYVAALEATPAAEDPDRDRHAAHMALIP